MFNRDPSAVERTQLRSCSLGQQARQQVMAESLFLGKLAMLRS